MSVATLGLEEQQWADRYLAATKAEDEAVKERAKAKAQLLYALGDLFVGTLPDGRTVRRFDTDVASAVITRKGYTKTTLAIS